ncbi:MAG: HAD-IA family hydrolase [Anaerolineales bacterium]
MRALIFDFDGLILDTEMPDYQAWEQVYQSYGVTLPLEKWGSIIGGNAESDFEPYGYLESRVGKPVDREQIWVTRRKSYLDTLESQPVLPGVMDYLNAAKQKNLGLAIASSSPENCSRLELRDYFDVVVTADDVMHTKPSPELFLLAAQQMKVDPAATIVLEDSPNGIKAAKRAHMFAVAVPNKVTRQLDLSEADLQLNSLAEMPLNDLLTRAEQAR